jgi:hypothetical protein
MERFIRAQNVQRYRSLLERPTEETDRDKLLRLQLLTLLAEEEQSKKTLAIRCDRKVGPVG